MSKLKSVLLVDDDRSSNLLHKIIIERTHTAQHIQICTDGQDGIDYLTNQGKYANASNTFPAPDLIFLDIHMPVLNGFGFLTKYKDLPMEQKGKQVIVMLTIPLNQIEQEKIASFGVATQFLNKPLTKQIANTLLSR